jgi:thiaminase/transcriptional activator TenA
MHTEQWRLDADPIWEAIFRHPFLTGLADGTLDQAAFRYFVRQDYVYLRDFSHVLAMAAARSPLRSDERTLLRHAEIVHAVEAELHQSLAPVLGLDPSELAASVPGPVTRAYADHLVRAAWERPHAVLLAAVLPCYWIYREVGQRLHGTDPGFQPYRDWIETYAGDLYGASVDEARSIAERSAELASAGERQAAREAFWVSSRYEWLFWEQAWSREAAFRTAELPASPPSF